MEHIKYYYVLHSKHGFSRRREAERVPTLLGSWHRLITE